MPSNSLSFFVEINNTDFIFTVGDKNEKDNLKVIHKCIVPIQGIENYRIVNYDLVFKEIKKMIDSKLGRFC